MPFLGQEKLRQLVRREKEKSTSRQAVMEEGAGDLASRTYKTRLITEKLTGFQRHRRGKILELLR